MGSVATSEERVFDVEETIFVAVGKNIEQGGRTLSWAVQNFLGKKICVLHVHQPSYALSMTEGNGPAYKLKKYIVRAYEKIEQKKLRQLLDHYQLILSQREVQAYELCIERETVEKGIVDIIAQHDIRRLVMGAAADEFYTERLAELKSNKAAFVCQQAASSCHIWFVCKGHLIHTRGDSQERSELDFVSPLLLTNSPTGEHLKSDSASPLTDPSCADTEEEISSKLSSQCSVDSSLSANIVVDASNLMSLLTDEEHVVSENNFTLEKAIKDTKESKWKEFEEAVSRWKDEEHIVETECKAKAFQSLYVKEISQRKEIEDVLARVKQEVGRMRGERDEFMREIQMVQEENTVLESQVAKSQYEIKELEEKFFSAVELLINFRGKRDKMQIEHRTAVREVERLQRLIRGEAPSFSRSAFPVFSFLEINEATNDFDPSWRIVEGRFGTVYKGILREMHVAIKMLPSYGSKSQSDFQREVEVISRVRHPSLVTLIGSCPESRSLVYEYLKNGSLEDCLMRKDNTLPWQIRICIATDICFALIFLHSNKPSIVHGNVKPSNILLDANYVSKLGDLGIISLIQQNEDPTNSTTISYQDGTPAYKDPELESGELTPLSDVYSFGVVLLRLLTAQPPMGLVKNVKSALENDNLSTVLDASAGDWPLEQAEQLVLLALRCCMKNSLDRPDLGSEVWGVLEPMKASCIASASYLVSKKLKRIPSHFVCPILQEVMTDPRIAADGFTYEAEAINGWLNSGHNTSPMTNLKLEHCKLVPNYALQNAIQEWQLQQ
ncbi:hypothetical protein UlMin_024546 [Ulmus minor]